MDRRGGVPAGQVQVGRRGRQGADATLRRAVSSAGRAVALQAIGQRFDPSTAHYDFRDLAFSRVPIFWHKLAQSPVLGKSLVQDWYKIPILPHPRKARSRTICPFKSSRQVPSWPGCIFFPREINFHQPVPGFHCPKVENVLPLTIPDCNHPRPVGG